MGTGHYAGNSAAGFPPTHQPPWSVHPLEVQVKRIIDVRCAMYQLYRSPFCDRVSITTHRISHDSTVVSPASLALHPQIHSQADPRNQGPTWCKFDGANGKSTSVGHRYLPRTSIAIELNLPPTFSCLGVAPCRFTTALPK